MRNAARHSQIKVCLHYLHFTYRGKVNFMLFPMKTFMSTGTFCNKICTVGQCISGLLLHWTINVSIQALMFFFLNNPTDMSPQLCILRLRHTFFVMCHVIICIRKSFWWLPLIIFKNHLIKIKRLHQGDVIQFFWDPIISRFNFVDKGKRALCTIVFNSWIGHTVAKVATF